MDPADYATPRHRAVHLRDLEAVTEVREKFIPAERLKETAPVVVVHLRSEYPGALDPQWLHPQYGTAHSRSGRRKDLWPSRPGRPCLLADSKPTEEGSHATRSGDGPQRWGHAALTPVNEGWRS